MARSRVAKNEGDRRADTAGGPQIVQLQGLLHGEHREPHEYREYDHLLQDLELPEIHRRVADPVGEWRLLEAASLLKKIEALPR